MNKVDVVAKYESLNALVQLEDFTFSGNVMVFYESGRIVGYADVRYDKSIDQLFINEIEMIDKGAGYGRAAIEALKNHFTKVTSIAGESIDKSVPFWSKMGAEFHDSCRQCPLMGCDECPLLLYDEYCDDYNEYGFVIYIDEKIKIAV